MPNSIEIITRFEHAFRASDQATIDELCDPGLVDHNPAPDREPTLAGFKPALWACAALAVLAAVSALGITPSRRQTSTQAEPAELPIAA